MWPERTRSRLPSSGPAATISLSLAPWGDAHGGSAEVVADEVGDLAVALVAGGIEGDQAGEKGLVGERFGGHRFAGDGSTIATQAGAGVVK